MKSTRDASRGIAVHNRQRKHQLDTRQIEELTRCAANLLGLRQIEVSVVFLSDRKMADLNLKFHATQGPTDILTFDYGDTAELVISMDHVMANARRYGSTARRECHLYVVHGLLHLAGYRDDTAPRRRHMRRAERQILLELNQPSSPRAGRREGD